jgi:trk system potassium uptake protein TrkH
MQSPTIQTKKLIGFPLIFSYLTMFMVVIGIIMLMPMIVLFFDISEFRLSLNFLIPGLSLILIGFIFHKRYSNYEKSQLARHQDAVLVVSTWVLAILLSTIPMLLLGYSFTHAIFEITSGYSTTGLSVVDVTQAPKILLLYRSFLQFFGGVGFVLVLTSAISDKLGMRLYQAEGHNDRLVPNLLKSGQIIMRIYIFYIVLGIIFYVIFGMPLFDAINHSISAVATGGFSTKSASIGYYQSLEIEIITIVLMILGGTNFFIHLLLFRKKFKDVFSHIELKVFGIIAFVSISFATMSVMNQMNLAFGESLRISSFQLISAITGTGYQNIDGFTELPSVLFFLIILTMILGAGTGSTAGGIKQYRIGLMAKSQYWQVKDMLSHKKTVRTKFINRLGKKMVIEHEDITQNYMFITTYIVVLLLGAFMMMLYGHSFENSMFEFASALGTVGLSVGILNASAPNFLLWTGTFGMFLGRLEFYVIFIALSKVVLDMTHKQVV